MSDKILIVSLILSNTIFLFRANLSIIYAPTSKQYSFRFLHIILGLPPRHSPSKPLINQSTQPKLYNTAAHNKLGHTIHRHSINPARILAR